MDNRVRILHVITGMGSGGAEMFLMNMYRNMDHEKIVFDFLLQSDENLYKEKGDERDMNQTAGRIRQSTLDWLCEQADKAREKGKQVVVVQPVL